MIVQLSYAFPYPSVVRPINYQDAPRLLTLGRGSYIISGTVDFHRGSANILIGHYTSIATDVLFCLRQDHDHSRVSTFHFDVLDMKDPTQALASTHVHENKFGHERDQVIIGNDVWIGQGVTIMGGVHIGNGAVIGARTVVAKDVPPYAVVVGNPARVVKYRFPEETIQKLQAIKWWHWPVERVKSLVDTGDVETFANTYYTPVPRAEDDAAKFLQQMKAGGKTVCVFSPVLSEDDEEPCRHVLEQYIRDFHAGDPIALFIEIEGEGNPVRPILDEVGQGKNNLPEILFYKKGGAVPLSILQNADYLITTKNFRSLVYMDYGADYGVKRLYAWSEDVFGRVRGKRPAAGAHARPLLTIGIPTYNRSRFLNKCLDAIYSSIGAESDVEILVSDNHSTDNTREVAESYAKKYPSLRYVCNKENVGAKNFHLVWERAKGEYVVALGDDDYLVDGIIRQVLRVIREGRKPSVIAILHSPGSPYSFAYGKGLNEYVDSVSYMSTAIATAFFRKDDINPVLAAGTAAHKWFEQVQLQFEVLLRNPMFAAVWGDVWRADSGDQKQMTPEQFDELHAQQKLGDLGDVFIKAYLDILDKYREKGLSGETVRREKKRLVDGMILPWCRKIRMRNTGWQSDRVLEHYCTYYKDEPYFEEKKAELEGILGS